MDRETNIYLQIATDRQIYKQGDRQKQREGERERINNCNNNEDVLNFIYPESSQSRFGMHGIPISRVIFANISNK